MKKHEVIDQLIRDENGTLLLYIIVFIAFMYSLYYNK